MKSERLISKLWVEGSDFYQLSDGASAFLEINKLNLLIGRNNSGKSKFARSIFSWDDTAVKSDYYWLKGVGDSCEVIIESSVRYPDSHVLDSKISHWIDCSRFCNRLQFREFLQVMNGFWNKYYVLSGAGNVGGVRDFIGETRRFVDDIRSSYGNIDVSRFYIPTLRGMRKLSDEEDPYVLRTARDYFKDSKFGLITGHDLYSEMAKYLLGTPEMRDQIKMYEAKIGEYFFEGQKVAIIPRYGEDVVYVIVGDDDEFPIYKLGDGLQQLIILTYKAYLEKEPAIFFVEEPEVHLHAGMLRKLMYFWDKETSWHQFFITTHSNHLLSIEELRDSINVFKFNKIKGKCNISQVDKDRSLLNDLGVQASSVYLANCTIWVEGITDRRYLQTYMRRYLRDLKAGEAAGETPSVYHRFVENYHYSFVEYQGGGLAHWDFGTDDEDKLQADVVSPEIFLMADLDIKSKGDRFDRLQASLGDRLYTTPGKEIENLLPDTIVKQVVMNLFERKQKRSRGGLHTDKVSSINLVYSDYSQSDEGLGHHIDTALGLEGKGPVDKDKRPSPHVFSEESGTVKEKVKFCEEACKLMDASDETWQLPPPVKDLCEKIFSHIARHND